MKFTRFAKHTFVVSFFIGSCLPLVAHAQVDQTQAMERMDRIERDLMLMHRQVARSGDNATYSTNNNDSGGVGNAGQLEVRFSAIEEQLRDMHGKIEENENRSRKLAETLERMQKDIDLRFTELSQAPAAAAPIKPGAAPQPQADNKSGSLGTLHSNDTKKDKADKSDSDTGEQTSFASPREHYNYAFRLLNQTQYEDSAASFEAFTKKYPKDPLVGNAYYWEGETYYIRRDYVNAADNFRKGFEALPEGPKAADNLLKLAMSLNAINRYKDACLVLQQITTKFKKSSASVVEKAELEQKRLGCHKT